VNIRPTRPTGGRLTDASALPLVPGADVRPARIGRPITNLLAWVHIEAKICDVAPRPENLPVAAEKL